MARYRPNVDYTSASQVDESGHAAFIPKTEMTDATGTALGTAGNPLVTSPAASAGTQQIVGNVAHDAADSGAPVKIGGFGSSVVPTPLVANGDRVNAWYSLFGTQNVTLAGAVIADGSTAATNALFTIAGASSVLATTGMLWNGSTWSLPRGDTVGAYVVATPTTAAANAITPVVAAAASSLVIKASAGNFYGASVTNGVTPGFLIAYNATAAPAPAAALTASLILGCVAVGASASGSIDMAGIPDRFSAGITLLFSTSTTSYAVPATLPLFLKGRGV